MSDQVFTLADLANFDGKNGNPSYAAFRGKVYDVSGVFKSGEHNGVFAGNDLTKTFRKAPHGERVLNNRKVVGILI